MSDPASLARRVIEQTDTHLFLTGKAGTGKTTFLRRLVAGTNKRLVVLAPTGIAAINAGGSTIHSFFQFPLAPFLPDSIFRRGDLKLRSQKIKLIRSLDLIVIDEISMVRCDLLDRIDQTLRRVRGRFDKPFGGVQLLMIGDLWQLAPVAKESEWQLLRTYYATPYFFSARVLSEARFMSVELTHVFRQSDAHFVNLLGRVRMGTADAAVLQELNSRYRRDFQPPREEGYIRLVTHNAQADRINAAQMDQLPARAFTFEASVQGDFPEASFPTSARLTLKLGAQVMFIKNDSQHRYYNGSLGEVSEIDAEGFSVRLHDSGEEVCVEREEWENTHYALSPATKEIEERIDGVFRQFPVKPAWAITIHKSQGLTFERAIIDAQSAFAHGQTYVALSRLRTLGGLVLSAPLPASAIIGDNAVAQFGAHLAGLVPTEETIESLQRQYEVSLLDELFLPPMLEAQLGAFIRVLEEFHYKRYALEISVFTSWRDTRFKQMRDVAASFRKQYVRLLSESVEAGKAAMLQERLSKGAAYFGSLLAELAAALSKAKFLSNNKDTDRRTKETQEQLSQTVKNQLLLLRFVEQEQFSLQAYQAKRTLVLSGLDGSAARQSASSHKEVSASVRRAAEIEMQGSRFPERTQEANETRHPELFRQLREWRRAEAQENHRPAYTIISQYALCALANHAPVTLEELQATPHVTPRIVKLYASPLLEIIKSYTEASD